MHSTRLSDLKNTQCVLVSTVTQGTFKLRNLLLDITTIKRLQRQHNIKQNDLPVQWLTVMSLLKLQG